MTVRASALLFAAVAGAAFAQNGKPSFEAASVKVADHSFIPRVTGRMSGGPGTSDPGRLTCAQVRLIDLLMRAWEMDPSRIQGPSWLVERNDLYNVTAVMPPRTTRAEFQRMLQNLLIERFAIEMHHETRSFPGYDLVVAPGGTKLKSAAVPDAPEPDHGPSGKADGQGFLVLPEGHGAGVRMVNGVYAKFQSYTIAEWIAGPYLKSFIQQTTGEDGIYLQDKTGLTGKFDFTLKFDAKAPDVILGPRVGAASALGDSAAADPTGLPNLFRALQIQLGLKLVKINGVKLDSIVIDRIRNTPSE